jgi:hypothetical protein
VDEIHRTSHAWRICDICISLLIINLEEKRLHGKQRFGWDNNTKTNIMSVEWIQVSKEAV